MDITLYRHLEDLLISIDDQMEEIKELALEFGCRPAQVKNNMGEFMMTPLLLAKAQALHAMTLARTV